MKWIIFQLLFFASYLACRAEDPHDKQRASGPLRGGDLIQKLTHIEENRSISGQPKMGADMTKEWESKSLEYQKQSEINGSVVFTFNASLPTILCAVLQITDIELGAGEEVLSINIGDFTRWIVNSVKSNQGELTRPHVIVKPLADGLKTSLVITTTERTYHLLLQSAFDEFMHYVTFIYPEDPEKALWVGRKNSEERERLASEMKKLPQPIVPGPPLEDIKYKVCGRTKWSPVGAYTDGKKTYITMPDTIAYMEAPVLYAIRGQARILVNYRVQDNLYVVDTVLDKAEMTIGRERIILARR